MSVEPLSPFGRGANAPLAGRTIAQIAPPVATGGDRRATLAVAEALIEAGARALVVSDPGELASEAQAIGALHVPFPAATENPLAMMLNVRRLARMLSAERVDLVHTRSRGAAWVALGACRKLQRVLVTSIPGEGPAGRPRSSFESALAEGDLVIAASNYAAERMGEHLSVGADAAADRAAGSRRRETLARGGQPIAGRQGARKLGRPPHERVVLAPGGSRPGAARRWSSRRRR